MQILVVVAIERTKITSLYAKHLRENETERRGVRDKLQSWNEYGKCERGEEIPALSTHILMKVMIIWMERRK